MERIRGDRRRSRRYPIELKLRYKVFGTKNVLHAGAGTTCDLSTAGISFQAAEALPVGMAVELAIEWPARGATGRATTLLSVGRIVRSAAGRTCVRTASHEFVRNSAQRDKTFQHAYVA